MKIVNLFLYFATSVVLLVLSNASLTDSVKSSIQDEVCQDGLEDSGCFGKEFRMGSDFVETPRFPKLKIVGGDIASNIYPYMASLQVKSRNKWVHFCGASLVKENTLLTAAHCVKYLPNIPNKNYRAVLGRYDLSSQVTQGVSVRYLSKVIIHPDYNTVTNDLALVIIPPIHNVPTINITLPTPPPGTMLTVIGWGYTKEGSGKTTDVLMKVDVPIVSLPICKKSYPSVTEKNVCAGYQWGGKDSCSGDSGGPLFFNQSGNIQQIGIVSYGRGCAEPNYYGVYTNVYNYRNWITSMKTNIRSYDTFL